MAREIGAWLSGPEPGSGSRDQGPRDNADYPGQRLGLPQSGSRSLARMGRRFAALFIDWLISYGLAALAMSFGLVSMAGLSTAVLLVWFVLGVVSVRLFTFTPGQFALGLGRFAERGAASPQSGKQPPMRNDKTASCEPHLYLRS